MFYSKVLVITDNLHLARAFKKVINDHQLEEVSFTFRCTSAATVSEKDELLQLDVKKDYRQLTGRYDLIISLHCKQIFPEELVTAIKCINIHPGLNPYNRGWYPQVFCIINKLPAGATIHVMDKEIDHGAIIDQVEVPVNAWDTSLDVYNRVLEAEISLLDKNIEDILNNRHPALQPGMEGNYNSIKDFRELCRLDLQKVTTAGAFIDELRALTHGDFGNAWFTDPATGKKIFVQIKLTPQ